MLVPVNFRILPSNSVKVVLVGASLTARTQKSRNGVPFYIFINKGGGGIIFVDGGELGTDLFCAACSFWRDASFRRTIYTRLRSGTRPCRCSAGMSPRGGLAQSTRSTTRRAERRPAAHAGDTGPGCAFPSRTDSICRRLRLL
jgi:hypothetical protein